MTDRQEYRRLYYILKKREQRFSASKEWSDYDKVLKSGLFDLEAPKDISDEDLPFYREIAENLYKNKFASIAGLRQIRKRLLRRFKVMIIILQRLNIISCGFYGGGEEHKTNRYIFVGGACTCIY